jgi:hypothetical protein
MFLFLFRRLLQRTKAPIATAMIPTTDPAAIPPTTPFERPLEEEDASEVDVVELVIAVLLLVDAEVLRDIVAVAAIEAVDVADCDDPT